jgi:acyl carrier protein
MVSAGIQDSVVADLQPDTPLKEQGFDSVDIPLVTIGIKEELGIDLTDEEVSLNMTLNDLTRHVLEKLEARA